MSNSKRPLVLVLMLAVLAAGLFFALNGSENNNKPKFLRKTPGAINADDKFQDEGEVTLTAKEAAVAELCNCFSEILELRAEVKEDSRKEYELASKIKKAEIGMRACFAKTKQKHGDLGEDLLTDFEAACPDAQNEL